MAEEIKAGTLVIRHAGAVINKREGRVCRVCEDYIDVGDEMVMDGGFLHYVCSGT